MELQVHGFCLVAMLQTSKVIWTSLEPPGVEDGRQCMEMDPLIDSNIAGGHSAAEMGVWHAGQAPLLRLPTQACLPGSGIPLESIPEGQSMWELYLEHAWLPYA